MCCGLRAGGGAVGRAAGLFSAAELSPVNRTNTGTFGKSLISNQLHGTIRLRSTWRKTTSMFWRMDYVWSLVPAERKDFNFMKDWTVTKDARHAVRRVRSCTQEIGGL
jgi:hypothetical protein